MITFELFLRLLYQTLFKDAKNIAGRSDVPDMHGTIVPGVVRLNASVLPKEARGQSTSYHYRCCVASKRAPMLPCVPILAGGVRRKHTWHDAQERPWARPECSRHPDG